MTMLNVIVTYAIKLSEIVCLLISQLINSMRVLEHIEFVNDIELDLTKVCQVVALLFAAALFGVGLHLLQLHVDLVLDRAVPAAHMTIVE